MAIAHFILKGQQEEGRNNSFTTKMDTSKPEKKGSKEILNPILKGWTIKNYIDTQFNFNFKCDIIVQFNLLVFDILPPLNIGCQNRSRLDNQHPSNL